MYEMNCKNTIKRLAFEELDSTYDYVLKRRADKEELLVTAKRQRMGKGTKGRSFSSEEGGVYLTALRFYENFPAQNAFLVMANAAVAVCETLRFYGFSPVIKWANDVYINDKKICGILISNTFSGEKISSSVIGIGLNVCNPLPLELQKIATTMQAEGANTPSVAEVTERLIDELYRDRGMEEYLSYVGYMGCEATLIFGDERVHGRLVSVDEWGKLTVEIDGETRVLTAAEVSIAF